jgi:hypothetical protein
VLIWGLGRYKLVLIQTIVENAVIQKAPQGYPEEQIKEAFARYYTRAQSSDREEAYLELLLQASQRLEKIQRLESRQVDELLNDLDPGRAVDD